MSLTISVLVPDGVVLAADSLQSTNTALVGEQEANVPCPKCQEQMKFKIPLGPIMMPAGGSPFAQKLFNIKTRNIGILTYGNAFVTGRTIESHVREFERLKIGGKETVEEVADKLNEYFLAELKKEKSFEALPADASPLGFQVAGFDKDDVNIGKLYVLDIAKTPRKRAVHTQGYSATWGGDGRVVQKLWLPTPGAPIPTPNYQSLTLQDAIDYAVHLIDTTILYQRFAQMIPVVGGHIDVAVITHFSGFKWIRRKPLLEQITE